MPLNLRNTQTQLQYIPAEKFATAITSCCLLLKRHVSWILKHLMMTWSMKKSHQWWPSFTCIDASLLVNNFIHTDFLVSSCSYRIIWQVSFPDVGICCNLKLTNLLSWKLTRSCSTISSDLAQKIFNNIITLMGIDICILYHPLTTFLVLQQILQMSLIDLLILHNWQSSHEKKKESERQQWARKLCWSIPPNHVWQLSIIHPQQNIAKMLQQSKVANVWHAQFRTLLKP